MDFCGAGVRFGFSMVGRSSESTLVRARAWAKLYPFFQTKGHNRGLVASRETHFWYVVPNEVKDVSLLEQYQKLLTPSERQNIFSVKDDNLQKCALLSRALVRTTIAKYCEVSPRSLKFKKNRFGKPEVDWQSDDILVPPSLHFNISHTSSLIACGVTMDVPIGVDVEEKQRKPKTDILSFARRYFTPREVEFLNALPDPESQRNEFIKLWTLKEAYVKALGRGFAAAPFKDFTIRFEANKCKKGLQVMECDSSAVAIASNIAVEVSGDSTDLTDNWRFTLLELENSHYAAVCVQRGDRLDGEENDPPRLIVRKTIPLLVDEHVIEADGVLNVAGLS